MERVLDKISLVTLELHVGDFDIVDEADDLVEDLVFRLTKSA